MAATGEPSITPIEDELDALVDTVFNYGWLEKGSWEQAQEIIATLAIQTHRLQTAIFNRYPDLREASNKGLI